VLAQLPAIRFARIDTDKDMLHYQHSRVVKAY
jgi:hypothetical protein